jgi:hypothetical protein
MLSVRSRLKGIRTTTGIVTSLRVNLSSATGRKSFVTACRERTAEGVDLDWGALVDEFAILVLAAEQQGRPFTAVGRLPARDDPGYVIRPMFPSGGRRSSTARRRRRRASSRSRCASASRPASR